jgi:hypothetical protein
MEYNSINEIDEVDEILWNLSHAKELIAKNLQNNDESARLNREINMIISDLTARLKKQL